MTAIVITGMHRSGTSIVADILHRLGMHLGNEEDLLIPKPDNPAGFWENFQFLRINDTLLELAGAAWDDLPAQGIWPRTSQEVVQGANALVEAMAGEADLWGWKDPRNSLLMTFWRQRLESYDVPLRLVAVLRHPLAVAESLSNRNGFSIRHSLNLWTAYNKELYYHLLETGGLVLHYDVLFTQWAAKEATRLAHYVGLDPSPEQIEDALGAVRSDLRHAASDDMDSLRKLHPTAHELYKILLKMAGVSYTVEEKSPLDRAEPTIEASVVVPTFNGLSCTRACIASVQEFTKVEHEIIVVDNGSTDGTIEWLQAQSDKGILVALCNKDNLGFAGAVNQGLALAKGRVIVLLNNDALVTEGWLSGLISAMRTSPKAGLVGAMSNNVSGLQQVTGGCTYQSLEQMRLFARNWADANQGQVIEVPRLTGFCLAIDRALIDQIGGFDTQFYPGCFEDDDYGLRAQMAGFNLYIARQVFVHHIGSQTFGRLGEQALSESLLANWGRFKGKWGISPDQEYGTPYSVALDPEKVPVRFPLPTLQIKPKQVNVKFGGVNVPDERPSINVCVIAKDEAHNVLPCLGPLSEIAIETILVDTGSQDRTVEEAQKLGATIRHFEWQDDFAAARNFSIEEAQGDWILWTDLDDRWDDLALRQVQQAVAADVADAYFFKIVSQLQEPDGMSTTVSNHMRLFRNHRGVQFSGAIHEDPTPSAVDAGLTVAHTNIEVRHVGYEGGREVLRHKALRNRGALLNAVAQDPNNMESRYQLAICCHTLGDLLGCIEQANIVLTDQNGSPRLNSIGELYQLYTITITAYLNVGQSDMAFRALHNALRQFPDNRHLWTLTGLMMLEQNNPQACLEAFDRAESFPPFPYRQWPDETRPKHRAKALSMINGG